MNFKSLCLSCGIEGVMGLLKDAGLLKLGREAQNPSDFYAIKWALIWFSHSQGALCWSGRKHLAFCSVSGSYSSIFLNHGADQVKSKVLSGSESEVSS